MIIRKKVLKFNCADKHVQMNCKLNNQEKSLIHFRKK